MNTPATPLSSLPERCVIVINQQLAAGHAANAAAVLALTLGQRHPALVGAPLIDADNREHPGLIPIGISVLVADAEQLTQLHQHLLNDDDMDGIIFPVEGQQTTDYAAFREAVAIVPTGDLVLLGIALAGKKKVVRKLTGKLGLLG
ncbi:MULTISPECIES: DUF2000 domain-containing protein [Rahnella]|jgi:hypothetical protein|uniref:DUF2000 domain-containing protein n=1 Tax=Rahnella contaminans TaxID=2703882 RepID=A0A6M2BAW3_9GAMM|nr:MULTISPECIES: DUF2000 domain-containing protein [Rahnella]MCS3425269.1 hypothetical protein [Rahnella sp. BIGb0603]NGX89457.1 DUF2000 domain-containing protein [Rahnella contaminans]